MGGVPSHGGSQPVLPWSFWGGTHPHPRRLRGLRRGHSRRPLVRVSLHLGAVGVWVPGVPCQARGGRCTPSSPRGPLLSRFSACTAPLARRVVLVNPASVSHLQLPSGPVGLNSRSLRLTFPAPLRAIRGLQEQQRRFAGVPSRWRRRRWFLLPQHHSQPRAAGVGRAWGGWWLPWSGRGPASF